MCIEQNHDAEDALEFITSLRHLKGAPSARPVSLRVQHALKMAGHTVKLQSQVSAAWPRITLALTTSASATRDRHHDHNRELDRDHDHR